MFVAKANVFHFDIACGRCCTYTVEDVLVSIPDSTKERIARAKDYEIQELRRLLDKANAEKRGLIITCIITL